MLKPTPTFNNEESKRSVGKKSTHSVAHSFGDADTPNDDEEEVRHEELVDAIRGALSRETIAAITKKVEYQDARNALLASLRDKMTCATAMQSLTTLADYIRYSITGSKTRVDYAAWLKEYLYSAKQKAIFKTE